MWTQILNNVLQHILPLKTVRSTELIAFDVNFKLLVSDYDASDGEVVAFVHVRAIGYKGELIPIKRANHVLSDISNRSRISFYPIEKT